MAAHNYRKSMASLMSGSYLGKESDTQTTVRCLKRKVDNLEKEIDELDEKFERVIKALSKYLKGKENE